jgi:hypothetical protein
MLLRENIPLAVVTAVLVVAIIVLYREIASIKATITQCPPPMDFGIESIVPPPPQAEEITDASLEISEAAAEKAALKPALKKRAAPKSVGMSTIDEADPV